MPEAPAARRKAPRPKSGKKAYHPPRVKALAEKYGFGPRFDLAARLVGVRRGLRRLRRTIAGIRAEPPLADLTRGRPALRSLHEAIALALYGLRDINDPSDVRRAARAATGRKLGAQRGRPKTEAGDPITAFITGRRLAPGRGTARPPIRTRGGRGNPEVPWLVRHLAAVYTEGTGKAATAAHRGDKYRGRCFQFVSDVLALLDSPVAPRAIEREIGAWRRHQRKMALKRLK